MKYDITVITSYALQTLAAPLSWAVHSVYRKTINIRAGSRLLALQAARSPVSPVSLVTVLDAQDFNGLGVRAGQPVTIEGTRIRIGAEADGDSVTFDWQGSDVYDSLMGEGGWDSDGGRDSDGVRDSDGGPDSGGRRFSDGGPDSGGRRFSDGGPDSDGRRDFGGRRSHAAMIRNALELSHTGGFRTIFIPGLQDDDFLVNGAAKKRLSLCTSCLEQGDYEGAAATLSGLIGLGIGLTPSGDDFLCGVLAGFILSDRTNHPLFPALRLKIGENLTGTNDISRAFLQCALEYNFSKTVKELPEAASAGHICRSFEEIGHSSGTDTLCGILFALLCP